MIKEQGANKKILEGNANKLKNRLFGVLCEFEKDGTWEEYLDSIIVELLGIPEEQRTINYYIIFHKVSACRYLNHKYLRKTIFDVMSLLSKGG